MGDSAPGGHAGVTADDRAASAGDEGNFSEDIGDLGADFADVKEQDRWLPIANVARIMKTALPENAKVAKDAKECMQECVSEFISFITSEASEKCQQEKRKTVNGEDILFAMSSLGFENYAEALKIYLAKYRETQTARGEGERPRRKPEEGGTAVAPAVAGDKERYEEGYSNPAAGAQYSYTDLPSY